MADTGKEGRAQYRRKVEEDFPDKLEFPRFTKALSLRYGINPGGKAAFYAEEGSTRPTMARLTVLQEGRGLGWINLGDMDLGQSLIRLLHDDYAGRAAYCIVKHEIPSGVATGQDLWDAFSNAWGSDPLSNFGGVHVSSRSIDERVARELVDKAKNVEVIYAPSFSSDALGVLKERASLRVVQMNNLDEQVVDNGLDYKRVVGGMLVQPRWETRIHTRGDIECISDRLPSRKEIEAGLLAWKVAGFTRSNAVIIGKEYAIHGIGSGQKSRIDAAYNAIRIANGRDSTNSSFGSQGTFMASDAFMPSTDVVELAAESGVTGIIFPLGSIKDSDVISAANTHNMTLLTTRKAGEVDCERAFTHR